VKNHEEKGKKDYDTYHGGEYEGEDWDGLHDDEYDFSDEKFEMLGDGVDNAARRRLENYSMGNTEEKERVAARRSAMDLTSAAGGASTSYKKLNGANESMNKNDNYSETDDNDSNSNDSNKYNNDSNKYNNDDDEENLKRRLKGYGLDFGLSSALGSHPDKSESEAGIFQGDLVGCGGEETQQV
jgi:hypothetical protein